MYLVYKSQLCINSNFKFCFDKNKVIISKYYKKKVINTWLMFSRNLWSTQSEFGIRNYRGFTGTIWKFYCCTLTLTLSLILTTIMYELKTDYKRKVLDYWIIIPTNSRSLNWRSMSKGMDILKNSSRTKHQAVCASVASCYARTTTCTSR